MGIIVVLVAVLLPAVESSRRAARTTQCLSNMKQLGVAVHSYLVDQRVFPNPGHSGGYSPQALLLGYIQAPGLTARLDRTLAWDDPANAAAAESEIAFFRCPSDPARRIGPHGRMSYQACAGIALPWAPDGRDPAESRRDGVFTPGRRVELEGVLDGVSATAAFAEHGLGDWSNLRLTPESDYYSIEVPTTADEAQESIAAVNPNDRTRNVFSQAGSPWLAATASSTLYTHDLLPGYVSATWTDDEGSAQYLTAASGYHGKGSNLLLCDGAARWVKRDTDAASWRALATYAGEDRSDSY